MTSDQISNSVLAVVAVLSLLSIWLSFKFRKKEFQIVLFQEQLKAYRELISILFATNKKANETYNIVIDPNNLIEAFEHYDKLAERQQELALKFSPYYTNSFTKFQCIIHLLPEDVIDSTMNYFNYLSDLLDEHEDPELGVKLLTDLNQKVFEVINDIRSNIAIDDLSEQTKNLLSKSPQFRFTDGSEEENDDEVK